MKEFLLSSAPAFFWLGVAIVAAVIEGATCELVSVWFVPGAIAALVVSLFVPQLWIQAVVFLTVSVLLLILIKTVFKKYFRSKKKFRTNTDLLIGERAVVEERIDNLHSTGSVRVHGVVWTARSANENEIIEPASVVTVCEINGVKLICKPTETENN